MQVLTQTRNVDYSKFTLDPMMLVIVSSLLVLLVGLYVAKKVKPRRNPIFDMLIDIFNLLTTASLVAGVRNVPIVSSWSQWAVSGIEKHVGLFRDNPSVFTVVGIALVVGLGVWHIRSEGSATLIWFALGLQILAVLIPSINDQLVWWLNNVVGTIFSGIAGILHSAFNSTITPGA